MLFPMVTKDAEGMDVARSHEVFTAIAMMALLLLKLLLMFVNHVIAKGLAVPIVKAVAVPLLVAMLILPASNTIAPMMVMIVEPLMVLLLLLLVVMAVLLLLTVTLFPFKVLLLQPHLLLLLHVMLLKLLMLAHLLLLLLLLHHHLLLDLLKCLWGLRWMLSLVRRRLLLLLLLLKGMLVAMNEMLLMLHHHHGRMLLLLLLSRMRMRWHRHVWRHLVHHLRSIWPLPNVSLHRRRRCYHRWRHLSNGHDCRVHLLCPPDHIDDGRIFNCALDPSSVRLSDLLLSEGHFQTGHVLFFLCRLCPVLDHILLLLEELLSHLDGPVLVPFLSLSTKGVVIEGVKGVVVGFILKRCKRGMQLQAKNNTDYRVMHSFHHLPVSVPLFPTPHPVPDEWPQEGVQNHWRTSSSGSEDVFHSRE